MPWLIEETDDCGVHWRRAELTCCYYHPRVAMLEALEIIKDEWRPPERSLRQLVHALQGESVTFLLGENASESYASTTLSSAAAALTGAGKPSETGYTVSGVATGCVWIIRFRTARGDGQRRLMCPLSRGCMTVWRRGQ